MKSIFERTKDRCLEFLLVVYPEMPRSSEQRRVLIRTYFAGAVDALIETDPEVAAALLDAMSERSMERPSWTPDSTWNWGVNHGV